MNANLLSITTIPIAIEVNITSGKLNPTGAELPRIDVKEQPGGYKIDAQPAKINIDTYEARSSMGYGKYNSTDFNKVEADKGIKVSYQGVAKIVDEGNTLARGVSPADIAAQNLMSKASVDTIMSFLPKANADVTFDKGKLSINYEMSDLDIDWKNMHASTLEFTPGTIEFVIKQRPHIEIEYVGRPIYVPPSADPEYQNMLKTRG